MVIHVLFFFFFVLDCFPSFTSTINPTNKIIILIHTKSNIIHINRTQIKKNLLPWELWLWLVEIRLSNECFSRRDLSIWFQWIHCNGGYARFIRTSIWVSANEILTRKTSLFCVLFEYLYSQVFTNSLFSPAIWFELIFSIIPIKFWFALNCG